MDPVKFHKPAWPPLRFRPVMARVAPLLLLLASGCASLIDRIDTEASPRHVFAVGFENLTDRYIEPVRVDEVTLNGLTALSSVDQSIDISRLDGKVQLRVSAVLTTERPLPHQHDAYGWAWLTADIIEEARRTSPLLRATSNERLYSTVFDSMLSGFDRYSRYTGPTVANRNRSARDGFGGLGVTIKVEDGVTVITKIHKDFPAWHAGIKVDDHITHVDGKPIYGLSQREIVSRLRGPVGEAVHVTVSRNDGNETLGFDVVRAHFIEPTVFVTRWNDLLDVRITGFNQGTLASLKRELERVDGNRRAAINGVIIDLRGNPGGLLDQAVAIADLFLSDGRIISTKGRHPESNQIFDASTGNLVADLPLIVLINGKSASAAEILAVALRDRSRAVLLGSSSFGKGTVQTIIRLPNSGEMILTWAKLHAPSGQTLQKQGIVPALCTNGDETATARVMAQLRRAAEFSSPLPADRLRAMPKGSHFNAESYAACPPSSEQPEADMEAARLLLHNRIAYLQAILKQPPSMAEHWSAERPADRP